MTSTCETCSSALISKSEQEALHCTPCMISFAKKWKEIIQDRTDLTSKIIDLSAVVNKLQKSVDCNAALIEIEYSGRQAAIRGTSENDNPYLEGSDEHIFWLNGWCQEHVILQLSELRSVVRWAISCMILVQEISDNEVSGKIDTIVQKLAARLEGK